MGPINLPFAFKYSSSSLALSKAVGIKNCMTQFVANCAMIADLMYAFVICLAVSSPDSCLASSSEIVSSLTMLRSRSFSRPGLATNSLASMGSESKTSSLGILDWQRRKNSGSNCSIWAHFSWLYLSIRGLNCANLVASTGSPTDCTGKVIAIVSCTCQRDVLLELTPGIAINLTPLSYDHSYILNFINCLGHPA